MTGLNMKLVASWPEEDNMYLWCYIVIINNPIGQYERDPLSFLLFILFKDLI